ncbi:TetR/AcrR family transcriptional regulator [Streptomyces sp. NPDC003952]
MTVTAGARSWFGTRERLVRTASRLLQHGGYENTPVKQLVREAGATLGSLYHFFPGGKQELAVAAIHFGDEEFAEALEASDWRDGCPVTTTALESVGRLPELQAACARAFANWQELVAAKLLACGHPEAEARELAVTVINTLEGAEMTSQVTRSRTPLLLAGRHLSRLVSSYAAGSATSA